MHGADTFVLHIKMKQLVKLEKNYTQIHMWGAKTEMRVNSHLISDVQDMFKVFAHAVVFYRQESGVENDAKGDCHVKQSVVHQCQQTVLEL